MSHLSSQIQCGQGTCHVSFLDQQLTPFELASGKMRSVICSFAVDIHCLVKQQASLLSACVLESDDKNTVTHLASS